MRPDEHACSCRAWQARGSSRFAGTTTSRVPPEGQERDSGRQRRHAGLLPHHLRGLSDGGSDSPDAPSRVCWASTSGCRDALAGPGTWWLTASARQPLLHREAMNEARQPSRRFWQPCGAPRGNLGQSSRARARPASRRWRDAPDGRRRSTSVRRSMCIWANSKKRFSADCAVQEWDDSGTQRRPAPELLWSVTAMASSPASIAASTTSAAEASPYCRAVKSRDAGV